MSRHPRFVVPRVLGLAPLACALLAGCAMPAGTGPVTPGGSAVPGAIASASPIAGVSFRPVSAAGAQLVASQALGSVSVGAKDGAGTATAGATTGAAAPAAMPVAPGSRPVAQDGGQVSGAFSGNAYGYYGWGWYYGGSEEVVLSDFQEAELPGAGGGFPAVALTVADPVVKGWAADARLVQSSAQLHPDGTPLAASTTGVGSVLAGDQGGGWRLVYVSSSLKEVMQFLVRPDKTIVLRQRWTPMHLAPERVAIGSTDAVARLTAAIRDKNAKAEEERTGKDYFFGFPFEAPKSWLGPDNRLEVIYDVPADATWNAALQVIMGKLVWQLSYYRGGGVAMGGGVAVAMPADKAVLPGATATATATAPAPATAPTAVSTTTPAGSVTPVAPDVAACDPATTRVDPGFWTNDSASGMVDATTGTVIRFSRPTKTYYVPASPAPCVTPGTKPQG